jgi:hypothetical protein
MFYTTKSNTMIILQFLKYITLIICHTPSCLRWSSLATRELESHVCYCNILTNVIVRNMRLQLVYNLVLNWSDTIITTSKCKYGTQYSISNLGRSRKLQINYTWILQKCYRRCTVLRHHQSWKFCTCDAMVLIS